MASKKEYVLLPGRRRVSLSFSRNSLWLGKDHVLHVINRGYTEDYRRFFFSDIQAIFVRETSAGKVMSILFGVIAGISLLFLLIGYFRWEWEVYATIPWGISTFLWLSIFVHQVLSGPTCVCHVRTAVQFEALPSLRRVRTARKAIAVMRHRIEAVQGSFDVTLLQPDEHG